MTRIVRTHPTLIARAHSRLVLAALMAGALLVQASAAHAAQDPEAVCQNSRFTAAAKYSACEQKVTGTYVAGGDFDKFQKAVSKCRVKYTDTWTKLHKKALDTGSTCDAPRFSIGIGVTQDNLTGLQWEQKTDNGNVHDKDNRYTWNTGGALGNGTVFTTFLATLNTGSCYLGTCDWRLPTSAELQTILLEPYPCTTSPCVEGALGSAVANNYWSATTFATVPLYAWYVYFNDGYVGFDSKSLNLYVRAVRAGL